MTDAAQMPEKLQALLVNVGGAASPAIHTLNEQQPRFICFFVSEDTRPLIREKILPALNYEPEHYDWIATPAPQNLLECYRALTRDLRRILEKWRIPPESLGVEYTAGTKPMSVAAVLATIEFSSQYFYVGARDAQGRDRDGIGVVLDGKEWTWFQTNPWEELAVRERRDIALLFNHGRFADAQERARRLAKVAPSAMRRVYEALAELIEGYALWDRFEYRTAQQKIARALQVLRPYAVGSDDPIRLALDTVERHVEFLSQLNDKGEAAHRLDALDMIANADRRARLAQKYDDAVARLYSVLEALARQRLLTAYGVKSSAVRPEQIPAELQSQFRRFLDEEGVYRLGLQASYLLLLAKGDDLGKRYALQEVELNKVLNIRNQSRLAHGKEPVRPETFEKMRKIVMDFAEARDEELPRFPELKL